MFEIVTLSILCILNAFVIIGFYESTQFKLNRSQGATPENSTATYKIKPIDKFEWRMILWWVKYYGDKIIPEFWTKPLYSCCTCMASVHGTYTYFIFNWDNLNTHTYLVYPVYILALAGIVTAICNKIYKDVV